MSHVMKSHMFRADFFDDPVVKSAEAVRVPRLSRARRWEQIRIRRVTFMFFREKLCRILREKNRSDGIWRFWRADIALIWTATRSATSAMSAASRRSILTATSSESTVGKNEGRIAEYIKNQLKEDQLGDQLSIPLKARLRAAQNRPCAVGSPYLRV